MTSDDTTLSVQPFEEVSTSNGDRREEVSRAGPSTNPDNNVRSDQDHKQQLFNEFGQKLDTQINKILKDFVDGTSADNLKDPPTVLLSIRQTIFKELGVLNYQLKPDEKKSFASIYSAYLVDVRRVLNEIITKIDHELSKTTDQNNRNNLTLQKRRCEELLRLVNQELERMPVITLAELVSEVYNAKTEEQRKEKMLQLQNFLKTIPNVEEWFLLLKQIKEGVLNNREETRKLRSEFFTVLREMFGIDFNRENAKALADAIDIVMPLVEREYQQRVALILKQSERQKDLRSRVDFTGGMRSLQVSFKRFFDNTGTRGISLNYAGADSGLSYFSPVGSFLIGPRQTGINFMTPLGQGSLAFIRYEDYKGINLFLGPLAVTTKGISLDPYSALSRGLGLYQRHEAYRANKSQLEKELQEIFSNFLLTDPLSLIDAGAKSKAYLDLDPVTSADIPFIGQLIGGKQKSGRVWYFIENIQMSYENLKNAEKNQSSSEIRLFVGKTFGEKGVFKININDVLKQIETTEKRTFSDDEKKTISEDIIYNAKLFVLGQLASALFDEKTFGGYRDMLRGNLGQGSAIETLNNLIRDLMGLNNEIKLFYYNDKTKKLDVNIDALIELVKSTDDNQKKMVFDILLMLMRGSSFSHLRDIAEYVQAQKSINALPELAQNAVILQVNREDLNRLENLTKNLNKEKSFIKSKEDLINIFTKLEIKSFAELKGVLFSLQGHLQQVNYYINKYGKNLARENKEEFENLILRRDFYSKVIDLLREILKIVQNNPNLLVNLQEIFSEVNKYLQTQQSQQQRQNILENSFIKDLRFLYSYSISRGSENTRELHQRFESSQSVPQRTDTRDTQVPSGQHVQSPQRPQQPQQPQHSQQPVFQPVNP